MTKTDKDRDTDKERIKCIFGGVSVYLYFHVCLSILSINIQVKNTLYKNKIHLQILQLRICIFKSIS